MLMANSDLSRQMLEHAARLLTNSKTQTGFCNLMAAHSAGDASLLLGFPNLADQFAAFLTEAEPSAFWSGVITNIPHDKSIDPQGSRQLRTLPAIDQSHPVFDPKYADKILSPGMGDHLEPCGSRNYAKGFQIAGENEFISHEIILAQAINGDLSLAEESLARVERPNLRNDVLRVLVIEYYRHDDVVNGHRIYSELDSNGIDEWSAVHLAIGISNRVPWMGYPFSDY